MIMFGKRLSKESHATMGDKSGHSSSLPPLFVKQPSANLRKEVLSSSSSNERSELGKNFELIENTG